MCAVCRRRAWLLAVLAGHIEHHRQDRQRLAGLLALPDEDLIRAVAGCAAVDRHAREGKVAVSSARGEGALCQHDPAYPPQLAAMAGAPAVLHVGGDMGCVMAMLEGPAVAIVGSRAPTDYGREVARDLARGLAASGVCVVSGMAMGVDAAAHAGALQIEGPTLAVMPGGADVAYPASKSALYRRLLARAGVIAELPAGVRPRRWCFVARNRIIAGLSRATVVVEARERSGALITAGFARDLGRDVGAVPGPVTSPRSRGANELIRDGAHLIRDAQDILDLLYGVGMRRAAATLLTPEPRLQGLLERVRAGEDTAGALVAAGVGLDEALTGLTELELQGWVRRGLSGRYVAVLR